VTAADGTEVLFKDVEGLPLDLDPKQKSKRKSKEAPATDDAPTKRRKFVPNRKLKPSGKSVVVGTKNVDPTVSRHLSQLNEIPRVVRMMVQRLRLLMVRPPR
jgi:hypothetical protein